MALAAARAPVEARPANDGDAAVRQQLERRLAELKLERSQVEPDWLDLTRYILPERGRYLVQTMARKPRATSSRILDPTGGKAHQKLAAFLMAGITNPALPWFRYGAPIGGDGEEDEVRAWLSECSRRGLLILAAGSFYQSLHQVYEECAGFGTGVMLMLPDFQDVMRYTPLTAGEYYLGLDERQEVDTLYREWAMTVHQLVREFGRENVSPNVQQMHKSGQLSARVTVAHAIEPNRDRQPGKLGPKGKAWRSIYWERGSNTTSLLRTEAFRHRPFIAPRWHALGGDAYGTGPGHKALPDVKSLQAGVRQMREAAEKLLNPPLQGDARHQNLFVGQLPGDINWISGLDGMKDGGLRPLFQVPPNIAALAEEVKGYRDTVKETFFNDLILAISQMEGVQPRNEMEIAERRNEKMLMLGPVLERFYTEALGPVVLTLFDRMQEVGILPPAPAALHGKGVQPSFVSVLAQAQKSVGTTGIEQLLRLAGGMAAVWPGVVQKIDQDEVIDHYAEFLDVPSKVVVPQKVVQQQRAAAQQQQQAAAAAENAQKLAGGAQTLSQTDIGGGQNALASMLGRAG